MECVSPQRGSRCSSAASLLNPPPAPRASQRPKVIAMSPRSFKRDLGQRPPNYRTPSPPKIDFEPISPKHYGSSPAAHKVHGPEGAYLYDGAKADLYAQHLIGDLEARRGDSSNTMEAFASIALAATPANQSQIGLSSDLSIRKIEMKRLIAIT